MHRQRLHRPEFESLESRRLLAQTPVALTEFGSRCGESPTLLQTPGIAYFPLTYEHSCGSNNSGPSMIRTDGTLAGTHSLRPIQSSDELTRPVEGDGAVYFSTRHWDGHGGGRFYRVELTSNVPEVLSTDGQAWRFRGDAFYAPIVYDGAAAGEIGDIRKLHGSEEQLLARTNGRVSAPVILADTFLVTVTQDLGRRSDIWRSDGTPAGTELWKEDASLLQPIGTERMIFVTNVAADGGRASTWATDGTDTGTHRLEFGEGFVGDEFGENRLIIPWNTGIQSLKSTDGRTVHDLIEFDVNQQDQWLGRLHIPTWAVDDRLYFQLDGQLWRTDGTGAGTESIMEIGTGVKLDSARDNFFWRYQFHATQQYVYFEQQQPAGLFQINRATAEVRRLAAEDVMIRAGTDNMLIYRLESQPDADIVLLDGQAEPFSIGRLGVSMSRGLLKLSDGKTLLFEGQSELQGLGYWVTDGTEAGTYRVSNLVWDLPSTERSLLTTSNFTQAGNYVLFDASYRNEYTVASFWLNGPGVLDGDLNDDGRVDFADFLAFSAEFDDVADTLAHDQSVDIDDFRILQTNFGKSAKTYEWPGLAAKR